ncbi:MAG TPA: hypothetical protein VF223_23610 [Trebonia sp.]
MLSLSEPAFFSRLKQADRILIAGAGGGFDVYAGLPLAVALRAQGKRVHLANLSFANLDALDLADWIGQDVVGVHAGSASYADYFPERALTDWLGQHPDLGLAPVVYAFPKVGVQSLRAAYRALLAHLGGVDAVVLVDGGTDILLRGDESSLGTPEEDITSLAAVHGLHRGRHRSGSSPAWGSASTITTGLITRSFWRTLPASAALALTLAPSTSRRAAGRRPRTWTRSPTRKRPHRGGRASSTARSRPPCAASSVTRSSPAARREASCSSTR